MWSYIVGGVFLALAIYFLVQGIRCGAAVRESKKPSCRLQCPDGGIKLRRNNLCRFG